MFMLRLNPWLSAKLPSCCCGYAGAGLEGQSLNVAPGFTVVWGFLCDFWKDLLLSVLSALTFCLSRGVLRTADACRQKWKFHLAFWDICIDFQGRVLAPGWEAGWISVRALLSSLLFGSSIVFIARILQNLIEEGLLDGAKNLSLLVLL